MAFPLLPGQWHFMPTAPCVNEHQVPAGSTQMRAATLAFGDEAGSCVVPGAPGPFGVTFALGPVPVVLGILRALVFVVVTVLFIPVVLLVSIGALIVGIVIFGPRLVRLLAG